MKSFVFSRVEFWIWPSTTTYQYFNIDIYIHIWYAQIYIVIAGFFNPTVYQDNYFWWTKFKRFWIYRFVKLFLSIFKDSIYLLLPRAYTCYTSFFLWNPNQPCAIITRARVAFLPYFPASSLFVCVIAAFLSTWTNTLRTLYCWYYNHLTSSLDLLPKFARKRSSIRFLNIRFYL